MSHKSGHVIVRALLTLESVTPAQKVTLTEIEQRDQYTFSDRAYIAYVSYMVAPDPAE